MQEANKEKRSARAPLMSPLKATGDVGREANTDTASHFGERALLNNEPRAATIKAGVDTCCWVKAERILWVCQEPLVANIAPSSDARSP